jgi:membrane-associated protease RseP (regulator of RpoE activity)
MGLLGSNYYVEHPLLPLSATRAMINIDMVGRGHAREVMIGGAGTSPELRQIAVEEANADFIVPTFSEGGYGPSDHTSFYSRDIPVLFFSSAPHEDYHKPSDDWEKLDYGYLEIIGRMIHRVVARPAGESAPIRFTRADEGGPHSTRPGGEGYGTRGYGPYLGTVPDFAPSSAGVRLSGVRPGSPAALAGLQRGDIIVGWNALMILNLEDYAAALRAQRPGDQVDIAYMRDGERQTAVAVLGERR